MKYTKSMFRAEKKQDRPFTFLTAPYLLAFLVVAIIARPIPTNSTLIITFILAALVSLHLIVEKKNISVEFLLLFLGWFFFFGYAQIISLGSDFTLELWASLFLGPILWALIVAASSRFPIKILFYGGTIITIFGGLFIFWAVANALSPLFHFPNFLYQITGAYSTYLVGQLDAVSFNIAVVGFFTLFLGSTLEVPSKNLLPSLSLRITAVIIGSAAVVLSGRSALIILLVISPLLILVSKLLIVNPIYGWKSERKPKLSLTYLKSILITLFLSIITSTFYILFPKLISTFSDLLNNIGPKTKELTSIQVVETQTRFQQISEVRPRQAEVLIFEWIQSPLFGYGFGKPAEGYSRSSERPESLELQYHYLLFAVGIIGFMILLTIFFLAVNFVSRAITENRYTNSIIVGSFATSIGAIVINSTNPYFLAVGNMWVLAFPLIVSAAFTYQKNIWTPLKTREVKS